MKCSEVLKLISSAVDNQLEEPQRSEFNKHIETCLQCRKHFELELSTKSFIHSAYKQFDAPEDLKNKILGQIKYRVDFSPSNIPRTRNINRLLYLFIPVVIIIVIIFIVPKVHHKHTIDLPENNLIRLIYEKYDQVLNGNQDSYIQTSDFSALEKAITDRTGNDVSLPKIDRCKLIGGWVTNEYGKQMIYTIHKNGNLLICCTQVNFKELLKDKKVIIEQEIIEKVKSGGKYISKYFECCSMIMWLEEDNLCVVTAEMDTNTLLAHLNK